MKVFVAGATGALGRELVPQLVARGHEVVGMTRTASKQDGLRALGARPVVADALDPDAVAQAVASAEPDPVTGGSTAAAGSGGGRRCQSRQRLCAIWKSQVEKRPVGSQRVAFCQTCFNVAEGDLCGICADDRRDATVVCVVEEPRDVVAVEKTGEFHGRYHVLQGAISPIEGVGPEQLRVRELLDRIGREGISEVILCTNPNLEGEATALYLARLLKPLGLRVTRIASGLPVGGDLEYADELTLGRALEGRRDVEA